MRTDELWETAGFDAPGYLERIGHPPVTVADAATLRSLHRAHTLAIPFENLDIVFGRTPALDQESLRRKLIGRSRGGYCYEQNLLFTAALERLGYRVTRSAARVNPAGDPPGPRTHMMSLTDVDGVRYLTDVGFGAGVLEPVPLEPGMYRHGGWTYRLATETGEWRLRSVGPEGEHEMYAFTGEPAVPADYEVYNHYTATHPRSPFTGRPVAMRLTDTEHTTLLGDTLRVRHADGTERSTEITADERAAVLVEHFGIRLTAAEAETLATSAIEQSTVERS